MTMNDHEGPLSRVDDGSLLLDTDVLRALHATGPAWQARANEALREAFITRQARELDEFEIPAFLRRKPDQ